MTSKCVYCTHQSNVKDRISPTECTLSDGKPCLACERQIKLLSRIEEAKKLLDKLITEEREARAEINRYHDPLHRLPTEIITHIFRLTLPVFLFRRGLSYPGCPDPKISELGALTVGAVCRTWRRIAWSTPHLWSDVMLTLHYEPSWNQISVVEEWLERSKPLPLNIQLFLVDPDEGPDGADMKKEHRRNTFPVFIKLFNKHSSRWKRLSLEAPSSFSPYLSGNEDGAPLLTHLQLLHQGTDARFALKVMNSQPTLIDVGGYTRLRSLAVSFSNVTTVKMDTFSLTDYVALLQNAPQLRRLDLRSILLSSRMSSRLIAATPPIRTQLVKLDVAIYDCPPEHAVVFYSVIFDSITAPDLLVLQIEGPQTSCLNIKQFLTRSSTSLEYFSLEATCVQQDVVDLLYHLPPSLAEIYLNLENLSGGDFDLGDLFAHLSCSPSVTDGTPPRPALFPNLEEITYYVNRTIPCPIPWSRLPNLLRPFSGKQRPLKQICFWPRDKYDEDAFLNHEVLTNIDDVRGLAGLLEDGVALALPEPVSHDHLLAMLAEKEQ